MKLNLLQVRMALLNGSQNQTVSPGGSSTEIEAIAEANYHFPWLVLTVTLKILERFRVLKQMLPYGIVCCK